MDTTQTTRLAAVINTIRPDWPKQSILTFIDRNLTNHDYNPTIVAFVACAIDPATNTPARLLQNGPWWTPPTTNTNPPTPASTHIRTLRCRRCSHLTTEPNHHCEPTGNYAAGVAKARAALAAAQQSAEEVARKFRANPKLTPEPTPAGSPSKTRTAPRANPQPAPT